MNLRLQAELAVYWPRPKAGSEVVAAIVNSRIEARRRASSRAARSLRPRAFP
jgi:hypothetical protein